MAEKESIRLSAETGEFTRVSGACNGEFGGAVAGGTNAAESLLTKQKALLRVLFLWRRKRGQLLLRNKHLFCSAGFGEREHSPFSGNGRVYSHSGACNREFGGAAVVCNQCLFDCTESLFAEKERSVVALQQTSLLLRGIPANFSNLTRYAPLLFIFTIKYKHFLRI